MISKRTTRPPDEEYLSTLVGVQDLLQQQSRIIENIKQKQKKAKKEECSDVYVNEKESKLNPHTNSTNKDLKSYQDNVYSVSTNQSIGNNAMTRSSSSSMQTLRRILEIEELRRFSELLELKFDFQI